MTDSRVTESSGLAVSPSHPGVLWTHDDSGNPPLLFALGRSGQVSTVLRITGVPDVDWEALAAFRDRTGRALLAVGDVGDNLAGRRMVEVDVVAEPSGLRDAAVAPLLRLQLRYPDGPRDAETLLVDPVRGRMFVVSKGLLSATVYVVPRDAWDGTAPRRASVRSATLVRVGTVPLVLVTDGAVAPGGTVLLRTYGELAVLDPPPLDGRRRLLMPRATASLPQQRQGEGLALAADGRSVLLTSEGTDQPVLRFPLPDDLRAAVASASTATSSPASPGASAAGAGGSPAPAARPSASTSIVSMAGGSTKAGPSAGGPGLAGLAAIGVAVVLGCLARVAARRGRRGGPALAARHPAHEEAAGTPDVPPPV